MKKIKYTLLALLLPVAGLLSSCELDNYEGPDSELTGRFIDKDTRELVQQDLIRGTVIKITEHGYDPVVPQYLRAQTDGSYADKLLFANTYTIVPERGNFVPLEPQDIQIKGKTTHDFLVLPYIRVKDVIIVKNGSKVVATFKLQQNVRNTISKIGLYAHPNPIPGEPVRMAAAEQILNAVADPNQVYTLELDLATNSQRLPAGKPYYFRVGALINVSEAKFNYAPAQRLNL